MSRAPEPGLYLGGLFNGLASARGETLDTNHALRNDGKDDAGALGEVLLLKGSGLPQESVVGDVGAGMGQFSIAAASAGGRVVAVTVSPVMLNVLEAKVSTAKYVLRAI